jgi:hypothetical protein
LNDLRLKNQPRRPNASLGPQGQKCQRTKRPNPAPATTLTRLGVNRLPSMRRRDAGRRQCRRRRDAAGGELYGYHSTHTMPNDDCLSDIKLVAKIGQIFRILFDGGVFSRSTAQRVAILPSRGTRGSALRGSCWMPLEGIVRLVRLGFSRYSNNNLTSQ